MAGCTPDGEVVLQRILELFNTLLVVILVLRQDRGPEEVEEAGRGLLLCQDSARMPILAWFGLLLHYLQSKHFYTLRIRD